jgi:hypothetical protein
MDKWKVAQVSGVTLLVCTISSHSWKDPGTDEVHSHKESQNGPGQQIGRGAVEMAVSTGTMPPFVNTMDSNELRRYRSNASTYFHSQGEQQIPFPMRFL